MLIFLLLPAFCPMVLIATASIASKSNNKQQKQHKLNLLLFTPILMYCEDMLQCWTDVNLASGCRSSFCTDNVRTTLFFANILNNTDWARIRTVVQHTALVWQRDASLSKIPIKKAEPVYWNSTCKSLTAYAATALREAAGYGIFFCHFRSTYPELGAWCVIESHWKLFGAEATR